MNPNDEPLRLPETDLRPGSPSQQSRDRRLDPPPKELQVYLFLGRLFGVLHGAIVAVVLVVAWKAADHASPGYWAYALLALAVGASLTLLSLWLHERERGGAG